MLTVLGVLALLWACFVVAICAICAAGGAADERSEEWYSEQNCRTEDVDQQERGAA
jgi:hypothetical protein